MEYSRIEKVLIFSIFLFSAILIGITESKGELVKDNQVLLATGMVFCALGFIWMAIKSWRWNRNQNS